MKIEFTIREEEWEKAAAGRWLPEAEPLFDYFYGEVQIRAEDETLFEKSYNLSVADLAVGLRDLIRGWDLRKGEGFASFHQADDNLALEFERHGDELRIEHVNTGRAITVGTDEFIQSVTRFVGEFVNEARRRIDRVDEWGDLVALAPADGAADLR